MLIKLKMTLEKPFLPQDNSQCFISFIKKSTEAYNKAFYQKLYGNKSIKSFTFSKYFSKPEFKDGIIALGNTEINLTFSTGCFTDGIDLYNAFVLQKNKSFALPNANSVTVKDIRIENHKPMIENSVKIKMLSPLVVRNHIKGENDECYIFSDEAFAQQLYEITRDELSELCGIQLDEDGFLFESISPKKTVTHSMGAAFSCSIGTYRLTAPIEVINALYQFGIGSRRGAGYGMFDIIK